MTRRQGIAALACGLCAWGLSGCLHCADAPREPVAIAPQKSTDLAARAAAEGLAPRSPYLVSLGTPGSPKPVEPAEPPEPARQQEPPPRPPAPTPGPAAEMALAPAPPPRPDAPAVAAFRCMVEKHPPEEALALLESHDPADRELLRGLLKVAARLGDRDSPRASAAEMAGLVEQMEALTRVLRPRAALVLDKLCFCRPRSIDTFGVYEPLEDGHAFRAAGPGRPGEHVQVYAEVRNFTSRPVGDHFETVLQGQLKIDGTKLKGEDGPSAHKIIILPLKACTDRSRTPRQDFFVNLHFDVPPSLPPGSYTLWVEVLDMTPAADGSKRPPRVARRSLDFRVTADAGAMR
jgi:hypothetical protein